MRPEQAMRIYLAECSVHAEVLDAGLADARAWTPLAPGIPVKKEALRILDQIAYRFAKLQDSMGEKVMPLILTLAQEPVSENATFAEKLNRLERIGAIPSAEEWKKYRIVRNSIAHEYPDDPELKTSAINRLLEGATSLCELYRFVRSYIVEHFSMSFVEKDIGVP